MKVVEFIARLQSHKLFENNPKRDNNKQTHTSAEKKAALEHFLQVIQLKLVSTYV